VSEPAPSRYRIVERDRRLTVIDTWAKGGASPPPGAAMIQRPGDRRATDASGPNQSATNVLRRLALAACLDARDAEGRPLFTTSSWFDARGPRTFALGRSGVRRLGATMLALMLAAIIVVILAATADIAAWLAMVFVIGIFAGQGKPLSTRWADRFASMPDD
jgi:hypothetical protein